MIPEMLSSAPTSAAAARVVAWRLASPYRSLELADCSEAVPWEVSARAQQMYAPYHCTGKASKKSLKNQPGEECI